MASKAAIWNLAVSHLLGTSTITSTTPVDTNEKRVCNSFYEQALKTTLEDHDWRFASKEITLSLESGTPPGTWAYHYAYPTDCIVPREIVVPRIANRPVVAGAGYYPESEQPYAPRPIAYEVWLNEAEDSKVIATDQKDACLRYTVYISSVESLLPETFVLALSYKLAYFICLGLTGNPELKQSMQADYLMAMNLAKSVNSAHSYKDPHYEADWVRARG